MGGKMAVSAGPPARDRGPGPGKDRGGPTDRVSRGKQPGLAMDRAGLGPDKGHGDNSK